MTQRRQISEMIWGGIFGALAVFLPVIFHAFNLGAEFMPMFFPILVAGFTLYWRVSLVLSVLVPLLSSFLTGMPPLYPPIALLMCLEFIVMTQIAYWTYQRMKWSIFLSLSLAFLMERAVLIFYILTMSRLLHLPGEWLLLPRLIRNMPGIILNFIFLPVLVKMFRRKEGFL